MAAIGRWKDLVPLVMRKPASAVLMYHRIGLPRPRSTVAGQYVAPWLFRSQIDHLRRRGWQETALSEITGGQGSVKECRFAVTFDDAYANVYRHAFPTLVERGMTATVYVVAGCMGGTNDWDMKAGDVREELMGAKEISAMVEQGFEIGCHTMTHPRLSTIPRDRLKHEIVDSKHLLEDITGREVVSFAYPYGDYNQAVMETVVEAGYKNAVSTRLGLVIDDAGVFTIPRINVRWSALTPLLMKKIHRAEMATERPGETI